MIDATFRLHLALGTSSRFAAHGVPLGFDADSAKAVIVQRAACNEAVYALVYSQGTWQAAQHIDVFDPLLLRRRRYRCEGQTIWRLDELGFSDSSTFFFDCAPNKNFCVSSDDSDDFQYNYLFTGSAASRTTVPLVNPEIECPTSTYCISYFTGCVSAGRPSSLIDPHPVAALFRRPAGAARVINWWQ